MVDFQKEELERVVKLYLESNPIILNSKILEIKREFLIKNGNEWFEVITNYQGQLSLRSKVKFEEGDFVLDLLDGIITRDRELRTIEIGDNFHVDSYIGGLTNHSCYPTCYVDKKDKILRARREINIGDEINFDYLESETCISSSFNCTCGSPNCRGYIGTEFSKPTYLE